MKKIQDYVQQAELHENVFRLLIEKFQQQHEGMSIDELFTKYSTGKRFGIWTIVDFKEIGENLYEFSCMDMAILSGYARTDYWKVENSEIVHVNNIDFIRS